MSWSIVRCPYEGAGSGITVEIFVETEDYDKAYDLIRDNEDKIDEFIEHSIQDERMYPLSHPSFDYNINTKSDIEELLNDIFAPDYAIFENGDVLKLKYYGQVCEV